MLVLSFKVQGGEFKVQGGEFTLADARPVRRGHVNSRSRAANSPLLMRGPCGRGCGAQGGECGGGAGVLRCGPLDLARHRRRARVGHNAPRPGAHPQPWPPRMECNPPVTCSMMGAERVRALQGWPMRWVEKRHVLYDVLYDYTAYYTTYYTIIRRTIRLYDVLYNCIKSIIRRVIQRITQL